jgi:hypothetical protein
VLRRSLAVIVAAAALAVAPAAAASAATALPATSVRHTTGLCGWAHRQRPANKWETAQCRDYSISYSAHSSGTCSYHHGVKYWFK